MSLFVGAIDGFRRFLRVNNIPLEGVKITIEFPKLQAKYHAEIALRDEIAKEYILYFAPPTGAVYNECMGIKFELTSREAYFRPYLYD